ncbi:MAG: DUF1631 family protein [Pseudomonadales bacterium]|nr:DUF1631 family protein [Pseudomonadales bacterium]
MSEEAKNIVNKVKEAMTAALSALVLDGLETAIKSMNNQVSLSNDGRKLHGEKGSVVKQFASNVGKNFDDLVGEAKTELSAPEYGSLSLIAEDDLEAIIAMEGMIAHSRNTDIQEYLSFTERLDTLLYMEKIDESNNPMDPELLGDAFKEAMRPMGLKSAALLTTYRYFNTAVFHELESVLEQANKILIDHGILPKLDVAARNRKIQKRKRALKREKVDPNERAFSGEIPPPVAGDPGQMFSMMQNLMRGTGGAGSAQVTGPEGVTGPGVMPQGMPQQGATSAGSVPAQEGMTPAPGQLPVMGLDLNGVPGGTFALQPGMMVGDQKVELVAADQLSSLLSKLQITLDKTGTTAGGDGAQQEIDLNASIGELLQREADDGTLSAVDGVSSDVINLITLLYEAIWQDDTIQIPVKELIGRTQISMLKVALTDPEFFDNDDHPARILLNELATAGISWTEFEKLEQDPMYQKMLEIVEALIEKYDGDNDYLISLVVDIKTFKREQIMDSQKVEDRLKDADARQERLAEIHEYATEKINERIIDENTHPFVVKFLQQPFQRFLVNLIIKEGPNGVSWKPVMNTIDVLIWTVTPGKGAGDIMRFNKLRPRLMQNMQKVLDVAEVEEKKAKAAIGNLNKIQKHCFKEALEQVKAAEAEKAAAKAKASEEAAAKVEVSEETETEAESEAAVEAEPAVAPTVAMETEADAPETIEESEQEAEAEAGPEAKVETEADSEPMPAEADTASTESEEVDILADEPESATAQTSVTDEVEIDEEGNVEFKEDFDILAMLEAASKQEELPEDDAHLQQVNSLPIGVWMEFQVGNENSIRCTLAAKISTIDKYVFVNDKGVKVVEKSRMDLARELKGNSVKIISEGPLVDRAMESVIGKLREGEEPGGEEGGGAEGGGEEAGGEDIDEDEGGLSLVPQK